MRRASVLGRIRVIYSHTESEMRVYKIICRNVRENERERERSRCRRGKRERERKRERLRVREGEKLLMARMCKTRGVML